MSAALVEQYSTAIDIYSHRRATPKLTTAYLCFKIILLVTNLMFMIFGCVLIGVGSYALNSEANSLVGQTLPIGLIVMGVFVLLLSALGGISAWRESIAGLATYLTLLLLITIVLFSLGVAVVVKKNQAGEYIQEAWYKASYNVKSAVQSALDCCGLLYWNDSSAWPCPDTAAANSTGCYNQLINGFETAYSHAGATGIAFSLIMGGGIAIVVCLLKGIRSKQHQMNLDIIRANHGNAVGGDRDSAHTGVDIDASAASMFDKHYVHHPAEQQPAIRRK